MPGFVSSLSNGEEVVFAENADFSGNASPSKAFGLLTNGQLWIGSTTPNAGGTHINVGVIRSPNGTILVGYDLGDITLDLAGGSLGIDSIAVQSGTSPVLPDSNGLITVNGQVVGAGTNPIRTVGGTNTYALQVQISQALAAADATKIGLANFDSAAFDVDINGFVQLNGGGIAATAFDVQANTAPGTDPVVPSSSGVMIVNGAVVANHSVVLETRSRAANSFNFEIQYATTAAATDGTKSGVAHFNSTQFSADASGFIASQSITLTNGVNGVFSASSTNLGGSISLRSDILTYIQPGAYPYTALSTDYFISVDSASARTINLPNAPTTGKSYVIKDRIGSAASNNITITTVGGVVTIDGATSKTIASNFGSINVMFNGTSYEVF